MTNFKVFLADTYALIEITGGNPSYKQYTDHLLLTTKFNLVELYYHFLRDYNKETADKYLALYALCVIPITDNCIKIGMALKLANRKENLSYVDCTGYALAQELGIKFLTGDEKFEDKSNVEFVK